MLIKGIYKNIENIPKIRNFILILIDSVVFITIPNLSFIFIGNLEDQNILINLVFLIVGLLVYILTGVYKSILSKYLFVSLLYTTMYDN